MVVERNYKDAAFEQQEHYQENLLEAVNSKGVAVYKDRYINSNVFLTFSFLVVLFIWLQKGYNFRVALCFPRWMTSSIALAYNIIMNKFRRLATNVADDDAQQIRHTK